MSDEELYRVFVEIFESKKLSRFLRRYGREHPEHNTTRIKYDKSVRE